MSRSPEAKLYVCSIWPLVSVTVLAMMMQTSPFCPIASSLSLSMRGIVLRRYCCAAMAMTIVQRGHGTRHFIQKLNSLNASGTNRPLDRVMSDPESCAAPIAGK
jgi:hypothetical protein